ncbi:hypothetical protein ALC60_12107 [Trachymyrmex zeteki]|uniref:Uncharacterized protein n=1 Tax=Mycetomoellerius zeteki TaxID=64791 RepID=A0A151WMK3_9HYME|nr:hypothetical protein ALC60_12107 [Trachymyrmex zeteki]
MEKPIPSYQRKWLLADRKKRCAFSAEDDNNKHLRSASFKLERESFFYNQPLTHAIFQYPASFIHVLDYGSPWLTFVSRGVKSLQTAARDGQKPTDWRATASRPRGVRHPRRMRGYKWWGSGSRRAMPLCAPLRSDAEKDAAYLLPPDARERDASSAPSARRAPALCAADGRDWAW